MPLPPGRELFGGQGRVGLARGKGSGGGPRASVPGGGVGGRGTGPRDGANFATCVSNARTKKEMAFFEGCPVDGGVDQGPWLQELGGGVGWMAVPKKGAWLAVPRGASPGKGWLAWQFHRRGQGLGGESKGFGSGRVGVLFFESWRVDLVLCSRRGLPRAVWGSGKGWLGGARAPGGGV